MTALPTDVYLQEEVPLARYTAWKIGGTARYYSEATTPDALQAALAWAHAHDVPVFVLGGGTNLLIREHSFDGLVVRYVDKTWHIDAADDDPNGLLVVGAGAPVAGTVRRVVAAGWGGLQWAEGLPGTFGGAVFGNAGCYGGDMASVLHDATLLLDGEVVVWSPAQLGFGYRTSALKQHRHAQPAGQAGAAPPIVLGATLRVQRADPAAMAAEMGAIAEQRKSKTPWGRSCGSVFKNPPPLPDGTRLSAGQLIDRAGLKGTRVGNAEISMKHANYIVNLGNATSDDVLQLVDIVRDTVAREFGVTLALEVQVL